MPGKQEMVFDEARPLTDEEQMAVEGRRAWKARKIAEQPTVTTMITPSEDDVKFARENTPPGSAPVYPPVKVTIEGRVWEITPGQQVTVPKGVWDVYLQSRQMPTIREPGVFQREASESPALT